MPCIQGSITFLSRCPFCIVLIGLLASRGWHVCPAGAALRVDQHGHRPWESAGILSLSLLGSYINIPVAYLPERQTAAAAEISYFGVTYVIPVVP